MSRSVTVASGSLLLAAGVLLTGLNLRIPVASVPPVIDDIELDLGLSSAAAGVLTSAPVLCFGLAAPLAPVLARRIGAERVLLVALVPMIIGVLARGIPDVVAVFAASIAAGVGIAVANVVVPAVIKGRFGNRPGMLTGAHATAMGLGAAAAAGLTVPLATTGLGWEGALAAWALPALMAAAVVAVALRFDRMPPVVRGAVGDVRGLLGDPMAWWVSVFMGLQSLVFYAGLAWLPPLLTSSGYSELTAGAVFSLYALAGMPASFAMGPLAARVRDQRLLAIAVAACEATAIAGLLLLPAAAPAWVTLFGIGQGGAISLSLTLIVLRSPNAKRAAELSGMAHTIGYSLAALGPFVIGAVHDVAGSWDAAFLAMLAFTVPMALTGIAAGRGRLVRE